MSVIPAEPTRVIAAPCWFEPGDTGPLGYVAYWVGFSLVSLLPLGVALFMLLFARDRAMRENAALMQHDDIIVVRNFVDEMRGPQHGDTLSNHFVHVAEDSGS